MSCKKSELPMIFEHFQNACPFKCDKCDAWACQYVTAFSLNGLVRIDRAKFFDDIKKLEAEKC